MGIEELVRDGLVQRTGPEKDLADKEFGEAEYDLEKAHGAIGASDHKWSIVKSYYAAFHAAKGVMFLMGYREKSHFSVAMFLSELCSEGKLEGGFANDFRALMSARQAADYHYDYSKERAKSSVSMAEGFIMRMKELKKSLPKP